MTGKEHMFGKKETLCSRRVFGRKEVILKPWNRQKDETEAFLQKKILISRPVSLYCRENILTKPQCGSIRVRLTSLVSIVVTYNLLKTGSLGKGCNDLYWHRNVATVLKFWFWNLGILVVFSWILGLCLGETMCDDNSLRSARDSSSSHSLLINL